MTSFAQQKLNKLTKDPSFNLSVTTRKITDEGILDSLVGVHFERNADQRSWKASQGGHIDQFTTQATTCFDYPEQVRSLSHQPARLNSNHQYFPTRKYAEEDRRVEWIKISPENMFDGVIQD